MPKEDFPKIVPWVPAPPNKKHRKLFRFASRGALTPLFFFLDPTVAENKTLDGNSPIDRFHQKTAKKKKKSTLPKSVNKQWNQEQFISGWKNYKDETF